MGGRSRLGGRGRPCLGAGVGVVVGSWGLKNKRVVAGGGKAGSGVEDVGRIFGDARMLDEGDTGSNEGKEADGVWYEVTYVTGGEGSRKRQG